MTFFTAQTHITAKLGLIVLPLMLMACATPKGEPHGKEDGTRKMRPQMSGTFVRPISLVFTDMDSNGDKLTTMAELDAGIEKEWSTFDRAPSAVYFSNWSKTTLGSTDASPTFMMFDKDLNGVITKAEFASLLTDRFRRFDTNNDDQLERSELILAVQAPQGERSRGGQSEGRGEGRGQRGGGRPPR